jgi:glycosyltransferase involved in cell wall biosynthesis
VQGYNGVMIRSTSIVLNAHLLAGDMSYRSAGIHRYLYNTLEQLPEIDQRISYSVLVGSGNLPARSDWQVLRSRWPTHHPLVRIIWEQLAAPLVVRRLKADLFHGMAFSLPWAWAGPSVVTIFDMSFFRYPERLTTSRRLYLRQMVKASARNATQILAISESGKREISEILGVPSSKVQVAVPGLSPIFKRAEPTVVEALRVKEKLPERFILYIGTLEPRKNLTTLLNAYAGLPERKVVKLVLVGPIGWQNEPLMALLDNLGLRNDIIMPGFIAEKDLPAWYSAAEVFAYPSIYEGFGMPVAEAMACGCPVVTSDSSSMPEAAGDAGILVPATDVEAWREALRDLILSPEKRDEMASKGKIHAAQFSWHTTARDTVSAYWKALEQERGAHAS